MTKAKSNGKTDVTADVSVIRTLRVRFAPQHQASECTWTAFCAAVTGLANAIPEGVNPTVTIKYGQIEATWQER